MYVLFTAGNAAALSIVGPSNAIYVDPAGSDTTGTRGNAARPFLTMQAALAVAQSGDEILVAPGTFSSLAATTAFPAIANLTVRGSGWGAGGTILTANSGVDVLTLNGANRNIAFYDLQIAGVGTGKGLVGTGTGQAGLWMTTLLIDTCTVFSATGSSIALSLMVSAIIRDSIVSTGVMTFTSCGSVDMQNVLAPVACTYSWDQADAAGLLAQGTLKLYAGTQIGAVTLASNASLTAGSPKFEARQGTVVASITGNSLGDNASAHLSIIVNGSCGQVDFQSSAAKQLPDTATALTLDFTGMTLTATGATAFLAKIAGAAANFQSIAAHGLISKAASTFTADAGIHLVLKGAALTTPSYPTPGATGDVIPPILVGTIDIAAGGALARTWVQLGYAGLIRVGTATFDAFITSAAAAADAFAPTAGKLVTGFTLTSTAAAGNTANWQVQFPG